MKQIVKIDLNNKVYGGRVYENEIVNQLRGTVDFKREFMMKHKIHILNIFHILYLLIKYKFFFKGTLLLTNQTTFFASRRCKNIVIIHHIDSSYPITSIKLFFIKQFQIICNNYLYSNKSIFSSIVTVSTYWQAKLKESGFENVKVIYNSFNVEDYTFTDEQIQKFRAKYNLTGKPVVYLGNCRSGKGAAESYQVLKNMDVHFVTSGPSDITLPIPNLLLPFNEYKLLLASADVVLAMSTFNEGWNRTVHEASLCGTSVIGSGTAGMGELLSIAKQKKVAGFENLEAAVNASLKDTYTIPQELKNLNLEYFKREWLNLLG